MRAIFNISLFLLTLTPAHAIGETFYTADEDDFAALPEPVEDVIRNSNDFVSTSCELIGKPINISGKSANSGYFATTADGCDWGAGGGPIWIVSYDEQPALVLDAGGTSVTLSMQYQQGLRNIIITSSNAGTTIKRWWEFAGDRYVEVNYKLTDGDYNPDRVDAYIVIIGGGTSQSALPPLEEQFKLSDLSQLLSLPNNSVITMESKYIYGLNPGYHIAVVGFCTQKERANSLREVANRSFPGSYIKKVKVDSSQIICPQVRSKIE